MKDYKTRNDYLYIGLGKLFSCYAVMILVMTFFRFGFHIYFGEATLLETHFIDILKAYFEGWRYDTIVLSYLLLLPFLFLVILSALRSRFLFNLWRSINKFYFFILFTFIVGILISDLGFYSYFQDHINILFFGFLEDDTAALIETIWKNYPVVYGAFGLLIYFIFSWFILKNIFKELNHRKSFIHKGFFKFLLGTVTSFILLAGGIRGGYSKLVLSPKYSQVSDVEFINQLSLNGVIAFERAIKLRLERNSDKPLYQIHGYKNIQEALTDYTYLNSEHVKDSEIINSIKRTTTQNEKSYHVIVILMESFGASWLEFNSPEFDFLGPLKKHFDEGIYFNRFISADNGTIGSLLTISTNIPHRQGKRFLSESKFLATPLESSANIPFEKAGYESSFYYGGKLGWRDIGKYFTTQGFDNVVGESRMTKELKLKGKVGTEWGLYDEHLFESLYKKLDKSRKMQFMIALSTTNHPPFEHPAIKNAPPLMIPKKLETRISREKGLFLERFRAFQYSNFKLSQFISKVKESKLKDNTIIVVTGDHNFWGFMNYSDKESFKKYTVPLYFYLPEELRERVKGYNPFKLGSHEDIMTTLYQLTLDRVEYLSFGEDLFSSVKSYGINGSILTSESGVLYKKRPYKWESGSYVIKSDFDFSEINKIYKSSTSLADFFIEQSYKRDKSN